VAIEDPYVATILALPAFRIRSGLGWRTWITIVGAKVVKVSAPQPGSRLVNNEEQLPDGSVSYCPLIDRRRAVIKLLSMLASIPSNEGT